MLQHVCFCCFCFRFSVVSQQIGREERLRNDLFCVGWGLEHKTLTQLISRHMTVSVRHVCPFVRLERFLTMISHQPLEQSQMKVTGNIY